MIAPRMKRGKGDLQSARRFKSSHILIGIAVLYLVFISTKFRSFLEMASSLRGDDTLAKLDVGKGESLLRADNAETIHRKLEGNGHQKAREMPHKRPVKSSKEVQILPLENRYDGNSGMITLKKTTSDLSELQKMARDAWAVGLKAWEETQRLSPEQLNLTITQQSDGKVESCPSSMSLNGDEMEKAGNVMLLPCGLTVGSSITLVGKPRLAHEEYVPVPGRFAGITSALVSQFVLELRGLKAVDGEDPPRIFHFNPRLKGDWSKVPVIEHNTCYRMQWGKPQRCDGIPSKGDDDTVDGFLKCEKWIRNDIIDTKESKTTWWLKRFIGRAKKPAMTWPFSFVEERLFVLTIRAGVEGYHIHVGGRHVTSFPYRTGFALEDATGLAIDGDVDLYSIYATSLPVSHPSLSLQQVLEMSEQWTARPLPKTSVYLFIGILSATNHFAERMAIRKTWMQFEAIRSSGIVVRFFVALNGRKEVNALLKMEAEYFGDVVILPFIDRYELVVLKTVSICEYGVHNLSAEYILKCDDDTFVRVDTILNKIRTVSSERPIYMGNLNVLHRPLRFGKWAVSFEEWPSEVYPPYANGPGYIISADIARFVASRHANQRLKLFKMEDVSMGMWVQDFNMSSSVQYLHSLRFCQHGCIDDYITAHYQSPKQMICLWDNLKRGRASCCNVR